MIEIYYLFIIIIWLRLFFSTKYCVDYYDKLIVFFKYQ